jgi:hypothetical protein
VRRLDACEGLVAEPKRLHDLELVVDVLRAFLEEDVRVRVRDVADGG